MRVPQTIPGSSPTTPNILRWIELIARQFAQQITFGHTMGNTDEDLNLKIWKAQGTAPGVADTDFTINHELGQVPLTIVGQDTNNGGLLYRGSVSWTKTTVTLRSTKASSAYNVIVA